MDDPVMFVANTNTDRPSTYDPLMLFAALTQHTRHIGLFCTAVTTYDEPFLLARRGWHYLPTLAGRQTSAPRAFALFNTSSSNAERSTWKAMTRERYFPPSSLQSPRVCVRELAK